MVNLLQSVSIQKRERGLLGRVALVPGNLGSSLQGQTVRQGRVLDVLWWGIQEEMGIFLE